MSNSTRVQPWPASMKRQRFSSRLNGPDSSETSICWLWASRRTRVANRSFRNENPTPASASSELTPSERSRAFHVRIELIHGTKSG